MAMCEYVWLFMALDYLAIAAANQTTLSLAQHHPAAAGIALIQKKLLELVNAIQSGVLAGASQPDYVSDSPEIRLRQ